VFFNVEQEIEVPSFEVTVTMVEDTLNFFFEYAASSRNKTDRQDITDILLKVELNTINQTI
jgi:hypothetical protein